MGAGKTTLGKAFAREMVVYYGNVKTKRNG